ncbi:DUF4293 domain-containing protein [Flavobacteriaceae bacterium]|nr:DUF4293 domain-containing protein [Flavobacteriaceae bacterium]
MIQRIQTFYMVLLILVNIFIVISIDSNPEMSLPESYFGYFRPYIDDYFFSEILSFIFLINILLFKYPKIQLNVLRFIFVALIFGIINFFDERSFQDSFKDLGLYYFIISLVLIFLTFMGIKKDQAIINSSNRLR